MLHLNSSIVELRDMFADQTATNKHMLDELIKISKHMEGLGQASGSIVEFRKTLHERFSSVHDYISVINTTEEKFESRLKIIEVWVADRNRRLIRLCAVSVIVSVMLANYTIPFLRLFL